MFVLKKLKWEYVKSYFKKLFFAEAIIQTILKYEKWIINDDDCDKTNTMMKKWINAKCNLVNVFFYYH